MFCLNNFKFSDSSLNDIKYVLNPIFTPEQIKQLDYNTKMSRAIDSTMYMPGIVGLNNIKANDYCNVILQVSCFYILMNWHTVMTNDIVGCCCRSVQAHVLYLLTGLLCTTFLYYLYRNTKTVLIFIMLFSSNLTQERHSFFQMNNI